MKLTTKTGLCFLLTLWMGMAVALAENRFVSEMCEVAVRTGPALDRKIIALAPSGTSVEVLNSGEEWCEVRLPSGKEGWAQTKDLSTEVPSEIKLARMEKKLADTLAQSKETQQKMGEVSTESKTVNTQMAQTQEALQKTEAAYEALKKESAEFLKFKANYDKNLKELNEAKERANKFESELNRLDSSQLTEGFLYGGGLVIFGFIAGFILKRPRRRSPLM
ncbi:MAG: TIGR04211 family SH3 domain-containing protein [Desulfatitalea sp.]|nr:TIGR04211 family SH3 domain-containing protein [Desulfatitalea sp.]MBI5896200.1 TIGR04211 family SH3 domain-containing protein [Desulfobacterales bacterium]